jgi:ubiquinone/menaquinone biosynthesis C-methylase UbiE
VRRRTIPAIPFYLLRERATRSQMERTPEPMVMDDDQSVAEYAEVGEQVGLPVYKVCALQMSQLLPEGATVVELGCGPATYATHLARERPDVEILGIDLSEQMLGAARAGVERRGLTDRVRFTRGDITDFASLVPERVDAVASIWALHHLPSAEALERCLRDIARTRERTGCALWLYDYARFKNPATHAAFLSTLSEMDLPPALRRDSMMSADAAFSFDEMIAALEATGLGDVHHDRMRMWQNFQVHWAERLDGAPSGHDRCWQDVALPPGRSEDADILLRLFRGLPTHELSNGSRSGDAHPPAAVAGGRS